MKEDEKYEIFKKNADREYYDERGKVIPRKVADDIMNYNTFITTRDNEDMFFYNGGIYHEHAENLIKEQAKLRIPNITTHETKEVIFHAKTKTYTDRGEINKNTTLIHLKNGIFDLEEMKLKEFDKETISTTEIPVEHDENADCPAIKKFLEEILTEEDQQIIQESIGYCLLKEYRFHKAFMFIGDGANGKSTLLKLLKKFLGEKNIAGISLQELTANRFASSQLYGRLANIHADLSDKALLETGPFKMATGEDMIMADKKFRDPFNFVNYAKMFFSANKLPEVKDDSNAFFRRWIIINFPHTFPPGVADPKLLEKLTTREELSGMFNWAIEGLKRLLDKGMFSHNKETDEIRDMYERLSSPLKGFVKDHVLQDSEGYLTKDEFYSAYVVYCQTNNLPVKAKNTIGRDLPSVLPYVSTERKREGGERVVCWRGIKLDSGLKNKPASGNEEVGKNKDAAKVVTLVNDLSYFNRMRYKEDKIEKNYDHLDQYAHKDPSLLDSYIAEGEKKEIPGDWQEKVLCHIFEENPAYIDDLKHVFNWMLPDELDRVLARLKEKGDIFESEPGVFQCS